MRVAVQSGDAVMLHVLEVAQRCPAGGRRKGLTTSRHSARENLPDWCHSLSIYGAPRGRWRVEKASRRGAASGPNTVDVLVVDDEGSVRTSICDILETVGITTGEATDGIDALERLASMRVGAMILDVRMPRLDGLGMLQQLRDPPPTVLVSAFRIEDEVRSELGEKVLTYLQKPFRPEELLKAVASALGRS